LGVGMCVLGGRARVCVWECVCAYVVGGSAQWMVYDSHPPNKYTSTGVQIHANIWLIFVCQYTNIYV